MFTLSTYTGSIAAAECESDTDCDYDANICDDGTCICGRKADTGRGSKCGAKKNPICTHTRGERATPGEGDANCRKCLKVADMLSEGNGDGNTRGNCSPGKKCQADGSCS